MRKLITLAAAGALALGACASFLSNVHQFSTNYQNVAQDINADVAAGSAGRSCRETYEEAMARWR
jgi:hypothetical protein